MESPAVDAITTSFKGEPTRPREEFSLPNAAAEQKLVTEDRQRAPKDHSNLQPYGKEAECAPNLKMDAPLCAPSMQMDAPMCAPNLKLDVPMTPRPSANGSVESVVCTPDTSYGKDPARRNGVHEVVGPYPSAFQMHSQNLPIHPVVPSHNMDNRPCWQSSENCGNILKDHQQFGGQVLPYPICLLKTPENMENAPAPMRCNKVGSLPEYPTSNEQPEQAKPFETKLEEMKRKDRERKRRLRQDPDYVVKEREKQRLYKQKRRREIDAARTYVRCVSEMQTGSDNAPPPQPPNLQAKEAFVPRQPIEMMSNYPQQNRDAFPYPPSANYRCNSKEAYDLAIKIKQEAPERLQGDCGRGSHLLPGNERQFVEVIHLDDREKQRLQKQRLYKQKQRQDPDFRLREKYKQRYAKQMKRQNPEYRERERELNRMLKRRKRMDPQFREREREIGRLAAMRKMMDPERRRQVSERQSMRYFLLMQNPEYREKIRERRRLYYMKNRQKVNSLDSGNMDQGHDRVTDRSRNFRRNPFDKEHQKNRRAWKAKMSSIMQDQAFHTWMNLMGQQGNSSLSMVDWYRTENENMSNNNGIPDNRAGPNSAIDSLSCNSNIPVSQSLS